MDQRCGKFKRLWVLIFLGIAYGGLLQFHGSLTGMDNVDGSIGVVFGLYMCSHPAAFIVDLLFLRRGVRDQFSYRRSVVLWLVINMLVLLVGWIVIFIGTTRLVAKAQI